jgi:deazaflavin-dependent oxidoreductase (nitroreductase family)
VLGKEPFAESLEAIMARRPATNPLAKLFVGIHSAVYRWTGGAIGGRLFGAPVLLLSVTGRKSGQQRTTALIYLRDGSDYVVVASYGGSDWDPSWWLNLKANPLASVQVGRDRIAVRAEQADAAERARLWPPLVQMYSGYAGYQQKTKREIPIVKLHPIGAVA